jgi:hypothetical protein
LENYASGEKLKKRYWQLAQKYHPVESAEFVYQHQKTHKRFYFATMALDHDLYTVCLINFCHYETFSNTATIILCEF